jgi:maleate isomerase
MTTHEPDPLRLGLVVPGDSHIDDEFWTLSGGRAMPFVTRTIGASDVEMGGDSVAEGTGIAKGPEIGYAAFRLRDVTPVAAAYVDTSISFVRGKGGDTEIAERLSSTLGCPAIVTSTAVAAACTAMGIRRMAAMSPYTDELNERLVAYFASHDIIVTRVYPYRRTYPGGTTSRALGRTTPDELLEDAEAIRGDDVDGLFLACTAVRTAAAIEPLEASLGVPVVAAVAATMWATLRLAGDTSGRSGLGGLFSISTLPDAFRPYRPPTPPIARST